MKYLKAIVAMRKRISRNDVCEDMRKIGITSMIAGLIGTIISGDTVSVLDGFTMIILGCIIWIIGLLIRRIQS